VFWEIDADDTGPYVYTLYRGRQAFPATDGVYEWELVTSVADTIGAVDPEQNLSSVYLDLYYKVVLETADDTYESRAVRADGGLPKRDWLYGRDIIRKEHLSSVKGLGVKGYLLKRKWWGPRCPVCTDFNTGEVTSSECDTCYGTGIVGGYYDPVLSWIKMNTHSRQASVETMSGHTDVKTVKARFVAYPYLTVGDVWINADSDERYIIGDANPIAVSAQIRSKPLIQTPDMGLVSSSDILYSIPVDSSGAGSYEYPEFPTSETPSSSSSSSSLEPEPEPEEECPYVPITF